MSLDRMLTIGAVTAAGFLCAASIATAAPMQAGEWHRVTSVKTNDRITSMLLSSPIQSDVCVDPETAGRGPAAIIMVDSGADCRLAASDVRDGGFTARTRCRPKGGQEITYNLAGRFTPQSIDFNQVASAGGVTAHSQFRRVGPCHADATQPHR